MNKITNDLSYRIELGVKPHWHKIVRWYFPEIKTDQEATEFVEKLSKKYKIDEDESLYEKQFVFYQFYSGISGLNFTWSPNYKQFFLDDLDIKGYLLTDKSLKLRDEIDRIIDRRDKHGERFGTFIKISPSNIEIASEYGHEVISSIPYQDLINFFVRVQQETGHANYQVKKFPKIFQDVLTRDGVSYGPILDLYAVTGKIEPESKTIDSSWLEYVGAELYQQHVVQHIFKAPYHSVGFSIKFFDRSSIRPWNEISEVEASWRG